MGESQRMTGAGAAAPAPVLQTALYQEFQGSETTETAGAEDAREPGLVAFRQRPAYRPVRCTRVGDTPRAGRRRSVRSRVAKRRELVFSQG